MPDPFKLPALGGFTTRQDALDGYRPSELEVRAELEQRKKDQEDGLFTTILKTPETLLGAHAIRGSVRGIGEQGTFEGFVEGFYRGLPTTKLTDWLGITEDHFRETYTADIRRAFGDTDQSGMGNFVLNLAGDILTDPSSFVTAFGKTAKGVAAGMDIAAGVAQGIKNGERAALVFKFPWMERIAFGLPVLDASFRKMGFQSLSLNIAEGLDSWAGWMRTGPLNGITRALTSQAIGISDPEQARAIKRLGEQLRGTRAGVESAFLQVFAQTPKEAQEFLLSSPAAQRVVLEMRERGLASFDDIHQLKAILEQPAMVPITPDWVQIADRTAGVGDIATPLEKARADVASSVAMQEARTIEGARESVLRDVDEVMAAIDASQAGGGKLREGLDKYLVNAVGFMRKLGDKEVAEGILNGMFEHYVPRHVTDEARKLINARFDAAIQGAGSGLNRIEAFMRGRKFTDLTTVEANAVVRELGTRATGYVPLDDIAKLAEQEAGFFTKIFDADFVKQLRKVDDDAADFFNVNPIFADLLRARASGQALGSANFRRNALRAISKGDFAARDLAARAQEIQQLSDKGYVAVVEGKGGRLERVAEDTFVAEQFGRDGNSRFLLHRDRLRDHVDGLIDAEGADFDKTVAGLEKARDIGHVAGAPTKPKRAGLLPKGTRRPMSEEELLNADLRVYDNDDAATVMMKQALVDQRLAIQERNLLRQARELNASGETAFVGTKGGGAQRNFTADTVVRDARQRAAARLESAKTAEAELEAVRQSIVGIDDELAALAEADRKATEAAKAAFVGGEKVRKTAARAERSGQAADRAFGAADVRQTEAADLAAERAGRNFQFYSRQADEASGAIPELAGRVDAAELAASSAAERAAVLRAERAALEKDAAILASFKDDLAIAKNPKAIETLVERELRERAADVRERLSRAKLNTQSTRAAIQSQIDELSDEFREYATSVYGDLRAAEKHLAHLKKLGTHGSVAARQIREYRRAAREGLIPFQALDPKQQAAIVRRSPDARVHFVDQRDLNAVTEYHRDLTRPDPLRKYAVVRGLDSVTSLWKAWTVGNIAFFNGRVRDAITGFATLSIGRGAPVSRSAVWDAQATARAFKRVMAGHGTIEELGAKVAIKGVPAEFSTADRVLTFLSDNGVLDSGLIRDAVMESSATAVRAGGATPWTDFFSRKIFSPSPTTNPLTRKGYEVANFGDNWVKITGFIDGLKRGETPQQALDFVRRNTYTPRANATTFMKSKVARAFPFGEFASWAMATTVRQFIEKPGTVSWIEKMQRNAATSVGVSDDMERILPDFVKDGLGVPYKKTPAGPAYFLFGGYLPAAELSKLASALESIGKPVEEGKAGPVYRYLVGQLNPIAKLSIELLVNSDSFSGAEIEAYEGQAKEMFGVAVPAKVYQTFRQIRLLSELDRLNVINLDQARLMVNAVERGQKLGSREELPIAERLASSAFGVLPKQYQIDAAEQVREARRHDQNRRSAAAARLRGQLENAPPGAKRDANIEALRKELIEGAADAAQTEAAAREYGAEQKIQSRSRATLGFGRIGR